MHPYFHDRFALLGGALGWLATQKGMVEIPLNLRRRFPFTLRNRRAIELHKQLMERSLAVNEALSTLRQKNEEATMQTQAALTVEEEAVAQKREEFVEAQKQVEAFLKKRGLLPHNLTDIKNERYQIDVLITEKTLKLIKRESGCPPGPNLFGLETAARALVSAYHPWPEEWLHPVAVLWNPFILNGCDARSQKEARPTLPPHTLEKELLNKGFAPRFVQKKKNEGRLAAQQAEEEQERNQFFLQLLPEGAWKIRMENSMPSCHFHATREGAKYCVRGEEFERFKDPAFWELFAFQHRDSSRDLADLRAHWEQCAKEHPLYPFLMELPPLRNKPISGLIKQCLLRAFHEYSQYLNMFAAFADPVGSL
jgi:hypothetical protein